MKKNLTCIFLIFALILCALPVTRAEAVVLTTLDDYAKGSFKSSYAVYSGPGEQYYRANSGKALYGGGEVRIFGTVGDWLLMGYQLSNGDYRIGYITKDALNNAYSINGQVRELTFQPTLVAYGDDNCRITDDPVNNGKTVYTVPKGTPFTVLATLRTEWIYVEINTPSGAMRGFIWSPHVIYQDGQVPATPIPTVAPTPRPTFVPTPIPTVAPYKPVVTQRPYTPPTAVPTAAPYVPTVTKAPYTPATPIPTAVPYYYNYPTATPQAQITNTYYHNRTKGFWFPASQYLPFSGPWAVYSGPGTYYWRAADGKATMGGGSCILYGVEDNWALIGYGLSNGGFRIGYVKAEAIPLQGLSVPYLDFAYRIGKVTAAANFTDDIVRNRTPLFAVPAGSYVLFLGYITDARNTTWAYIETLSNNSVMRGFIPADNITLQY